MFLLQRRFEEVFTRCDNTNFNHFVAATSRRKSNQFEFVRLVAATKFCCSDKDFHENSPVHTERFVAAMAVAMTCCSDLSPSVYRPLSTLIEIIRIPVHPGHGWEIFSFNKISCMHFGN